MASCTLLVAMKTLGVITIMSEFFCCFDIKICFSRLSRDTPSDIPALTEGLEGEFVIQAAGMAYHSVVLTSV